MKVTLSSAMRVRDVSKPLPHHDEDALAKVAEQPAARPRPGSLPPPRSRKTGPAPVPSRPGAERGEATPSRSGGGHRKEQARPGPQARTPAGLGERPQPEVAQPPRQRAVPAGDNVTMSEPRQRPARRKRVRRRRRGGQAGG